MPVATEPATAEIVKVDVACPPEERVTDEGLNDTLGLVDDGDTVTERVRTHEKPFVPDRVKVVVAVEPRATFKVVELVLMLKS